MSIDYGFFIGVDLSKHITQHTEALPPLVKYNPDTGAPYTLEQSKSGCKFAGKVFDHIWSLAEYIDANSRGSSYRSRFGISSLPSKVCFGNVVFIEDNKVLNIPDALEEINYRLSSFGINVSLEDLIICSYIN